MIKDIWIFHYSGARFSGGVFTDLASAEIWIKDNSLTGVLTLYPINCGVLDWAMDSGLVEPKQEKLACPKFVGGFTSAHQEHHHYESGIRRA